MSKYAKINFFVKLNVRIYFNGLPYGHTELSFLFFLRNQVLFK